MQILQGAEGTTEEPAKHMKAPLIEGKAHEKKRPAQQHRCPWEFTTPNLDRPSELVLTWPAKATIPACALCGDILAAMELDEWRCRIGLAFPSLFAVIKPFYLVLFCFKGISARLPLTQGLRHPGGCSAI